MAWDRLQIFAGNATPALANQICRYLGVGMGRIHLGDFPNGEVELKVLDDVRGADVFVIQSTCPPVDRHLMELLIFVDCLKRASASRVTTVIPHFGYARQDRKDEGRVPITAKLVANLITVAGADRVLTIDLHAAQIQGFFDLPVDHLFASPVFVNYYRNHLRLDNLVVVSPDVGGIKMARAYAKKLAAGLAIVDKRRVSPETAEVTMVIGDVRGKNVLLIDDLIATAGSVVEAAHILKDSGAREIYVGATHPVFCGPAFERLKTAPIREIAVTDTIPLPRNIPPFLAPRIKVLSVAELLAEAIRRIHNNESVSSLFLDSAVPAGVQRKKAAPARERAAVPANPRR